MTTHKPMKLSARALTCTLLLALMSGAAVAAPAGTAAGAARGSPPAVFRNIGWDDLLPAGWNPAAEFKGLNVSRLTDADPRAARLLRRVREIWDTAPANPQLDGAVVRVPGYVVPLETTPAGVSELLLVPHFGACIHSPPPPANQIIHVRLKTPIKSLGTMDTVWLSGALKLQRADTSMGVSAYTMDAVRVEPYTAPK